MNRVKKGDPVTAKWGNDVVEELEYVKNKLSSDTNNILNTKALSPFDVTSIDYRDDKIFIKVKPACYYNSDGQKVPVKYAGKDLNEGPEIEVKEGNDLFFNYKDGIIFMSNKNVRNVTGRVATFTIKSDDIIFKSENILASNIKVSDYPPLFAFSWPNPMPVDSGSSTYSGPINIMFRKGFIPEINHGSEYDAVITHEVPVGPHTLDTGKSLYLKYATDHRGKLNGTPSIVSEAPYKTSKAHKPHVNGQNGEPGEYWVELFEYTNGTLNQKNSLVGFSIDKQTPFIENTKKEEEDGIGRIVKQYDRSENRHDIRAIRQKEGESGNEAQIKVKEQEDVIIIEGNGKTNQMNFTRNGNLDSARLEWKDGLVTSDRVEVQLTHVNAAPNSPIIVTQNGPTYTIGMSALSSVAVSALSGDIKITQQMVGNVLTYNISDMSYDVVGGPNITVNKEVVGSTTTFRISSLSSAPLSVTTLSGIKVEALSGDITVTQRLSGDTITYLISDKKTTIQGGGNITVSFAQNGDENVWGIIDETLALSSVDYPLMYDSEEKTIFVNGVDRIIEDRTTYVSLCQGGSVPSYTEAFTDYQFFFGGVLIYTERVNGAFNQAYNNVTKPDQSSGYEDIPVGYWSNVTKITQNRHLFQG